ncbi:MAG: peptide/nickel transport system permease protein [Xanthobacteraceae bacterium]|nr:MAG: peptide/nickel transport system permease protein [Xanthobacteraceae bacterium]
MGRIVIRRLLQVLPLLLGVIVLNFTLIQLAPGTLLDIMSADQQVSDPALIELNRPGFAGGRLS